MFLYTANENMIWIRSSTTFWMAAGVILLQSFHCEWECFEKTFSDKYFSLLDVHIHGSKRKMFLVNLFLFVYTFNISCLFVLKIFIARSFFFPIWFFLALTFGFIMLQTKMEDRWKRYHLGSFVKIFFSAFLYSTPFLENGAWS